MPKPFTNSHIYFGNVSHRRFSPKKHSFNYRLYMLALDVDDIETAQVNSQNGIGVFGLSWYRPLRFMEKDYLRDDPGALKERITNKVYSLGGHAEIKKVVMLVQARCFGIYFSPANFYFCYDHNNQCTQMLAEVSNTPWNERHYYLVDLSTEQHELATRKNFQVSPFMDLAMTYFWKIKPPSHNDDKLLVNIQNKRVNEENLQGRKLFDASLVMKRKPLTSTSLLKIWGQLPVMTLKVVLSIYWQALRLFIKRVPFIGYQKAD